MTKVLSPDVGLAVAILKTKQKTVTKVPTLKSDLNCLFSV
ncbi:hypothetical protein JCM19240_3246 [Vibrio maritimus]|uniref:Uncharacterized protein n=1 Tax=Vibrio maritimus TaxID=990268 RepID=A0A090TF20_9VIBR|nr:hypothetical protein JCM19240_3246 [Vibrio maritimus]